jgi:hypothetical protein
MLMPRERPSTPSVGQQLPLPLGPPALPAPTLAPQQVWAGLSPQAQARVREAVLLVVREVLHATDRR